MSEEGILTPDIWLQPYKETNIMKIDRHNYEEFFILYWDNELTAVQKQAVENFVNQNPDLKEEFNILGDTRFTADDKMQFEEKDFLLNTASINITNYQEQLLNYIDDELSAEEKKEVERSIEKFPLIQKELLLLQRTKLQPEEVALPGKSGLYRREEKIHVISMTWFRVAVAAVIILIGGFTALQLTSTNNNNTEQAPVAKVTEPKTDPAPKTDDTKTADKKDEKSIDKNEQQQLASATDKKEDKKIPVADKRKEEKPGNDVIDAKSLLAANQPENKNGLPKEGNRINGFSTDGIIPDVTILDKKDKSIAATSEITATPVALNVTSKDNPSLYIPEADEKERGGGLKGFLRKTTRVFERRTKIQTTTEDNKLLVGAFAVSLK